MAGTIRNFGAAGSAKSTGAKSVVPVAAGRSRRKASPAGGASNAGSPSKRRSGAGGISDTTTSTGRAGRARSTPAATGRPRRTARNAEPEDEHSRTGGVLDLTVTGGIVRDLEDIASRSPELSRSGLAMTALALAREMDSESSATSKSMCATALVNVMGRLRELAPPDEKRDGLDDLASRRAARLAGGTGTTR